MSDLDLDAIRRHIESVRFAPGIGATLTRIVHEDVPALLAEVERLTKQLGEAQITIRAFVGQPNPTDRGHHCGWEADVEDQGFDIVGLQCELADARAEVDRLKAHQPDGGRWVTRYRTADDYAALMPGPGIGVQHVWYGPITDVSE